MKHDMSPAGEPGRRASASPWTHEGTQHHTALPTLPYGHACRILHADVPKATLSLVGEPFGRLLHWHPLARHAPKGKPAGCLTCGCDSAPNTIWPRAARRAPLLTICVPCCVAYHTHEKTRRSSSPLAVSTPTPPLISVGLQVAYLRCSLAPIGARECLSSLPYQGRLARVLRFALRVLPSGSSLVPASCYLRRALGDRRCAFLIVPLFPWNFGVFWRLWARLPSRKRDRTLPALGRGQLTPNVII